MSIAEMTTDQMFGIKSGIVRWFDQDKGYGFIDSKEGDVMVHYSVIQMNGFKKLSAGDPVRYTSSVTNRGLSADMVVPMRTVRRNPRRWR